MILADIILEPAALYAARCVAHVYCASGAQKIMRRVAYIVAPSRFGTHYVACICRTGGTCELHECVNDLDIPVSSHGLH